MEQEPPPHNPFSIHFFLLSSTCPFDLDFRAKVTADRHIQNWLLSICWKTHTRVRNTHTDRSDHPVALKRARNTHTDTDIHTQTDRHTHTHTHTLMRRSSLEQDHVVLPWTNRIAVSSELSSSSSSSPPPPLEISLTLGSSRRSVLSSAVTKSNDTTTKKDTAGCDGTIVGDVWVDPSGRVVATVELRSRDPATGKVSSSLRRAYLNVEDIILEDEEIFDREKEVDDTLIRPPSQSRLCSSSESSRRRCRKGPRRPLPPSSSSTSSATASEAVSAYKRLRRGILPPGWKAVRHQRGVSGGSRTKGSYTTYLAPDRSRFRSLIAVYRYLGYPKLSREDKKRMAAEKRRRRDPIASDEDVPDLGCYDESETYDAAIRPRPKRQRSLSDALLSSSGCSKCRYSTKGCAACSHRRCRAEEEDEEDRSASLVGTPPPDSTSSASSVDSDVSSAELVFSTPLPPPHALVEVSFDGLWYVGQVVDVTGRTARIFFPEDESETTLRFPSTSADVRVLGDDPTQCKCQVYAVREDGETLEEIAELCGVDSESLLRLNGPWCDDVRDVDEELTRGTILILPARREKRRGRPRGRSPTSFEESRLPWMRCSPLDRPLYKAASRTYQRRARCERVVEEEEEEEDTRATPFPCPACDRSFTRKSSRTLHVKSSHPAHFEAMMRGKVCVTRHKGDTAGVLSCPYCDRTCTRKSSLTLHVRSAHPNRRG